MPYLKELGNNSSTDKLIIIPAINEYNTSKKIVELIEEKNENAIIAPKNSEMPEIKVYKIALNLLSVLK